LAETHSFEAVSGLLWTGELAGTGVNPLGNGARKEAFSSVIDAARWRLKAEAEAGPAALFPQVLPLAAQADAAAYDLRPAAVMASGVRIIRLLAEAAVYPGAPRGDTVAEVLQWGWAPKRADASDAINAALVLCADHELNVSAFTARCVASAGATLYDVVIAGLAALRGVRHGGHTARVEAFLDEIGTAGRVARVLSDRLKRGEPIPGFGHRLYPEGDPRGRRLLEVASQVGKRSKAVALVKAVAAETRRLIGDHPTVDFGLVALSRALGLPVGAPLALFAIGRTAGWIGHALEQYQSGVMIRPRARYVGTPIRSEGLQSA
jgi:citrate synthase